MCCRAVSHFEDIVALSGVWGNNFSIAEIESLGNKHRSQWDQGYWTGCGLFTRFLLPFTTFIIYSEVKSHPKIGNILVMKVKGGAYVLGPLAKNPYTSELLVAAVIIPF